MDKLSEAKQEILTYGVAYVEKMRIAIQSNDYGMFYVNQSKGGLTLRPASKWHHTIQAAQGEALQLIDEMEKDYV